MSNKINKEIEYLRALSIILVLISHYSYMFPFILEKLPSFIQRASFGVGVDLFFCISGYVVSKAYIDYFDKNKSEKIFWPSAISFWLRRCYRLLPSAWLWVTIGLLLSIFFNKSGIFETPIQNIKSAISIIFFSANIAHMYDLLKPNNVYWSLSLEEQFYFLFPFFLVFIKTTKFRVIFLLAIVIIQFMLPRNAFGDIYQQYYASFRTDGFAWGILIYLFSKTEFYQKINPSKLPYSSLLSVIIYFILIASITLSPVYFPNLGLGLVAITSACFVWFASYNSNNVKSFYIERQLIWIGKHSYAIYLIHLIPIRLLYEIVAIENFLTNIISIKHILIIASLILTLYLSSLNYKYIENPLRKKGKIIAEKYLLSRKKTNNIN